MKRYAGEVVPRINCLERGAAESASEYRSDGLVAYSEIGR